MPEIQARALRATEQTLLVVHAESRHSGTSDDGGTGGVSLPRSMSSHRIAEFNLCTVI